MSEKVIFFDRVHIIITNRGKSPFARAREFPVQHREVLP